MNQFWWYASRATGIVATVLVIAALVGGFFFSSRNTGVRRSPAWWLDLHNWLGGLALAMTGVHMAAAYLDANSDIDVVQLVVPGASSFAITWGVLAAYLLAAVVFTSWPTKRLRPTPWRIVHLSSVAAVVLAVLHGYQSGSDRAGLGFQAGLVGCIALAVYALAVRILGVVLRWVQDSQPGHR